MPSPITATCQPGGVCASPTRSEHRTRCLGNETGHDACLDNTKSRRPALVTPRKLAGRVRRSEPRRWTSPSAHQDGWTVTLRPSPALTAELPRWNSQILQCSPTALEPDQPVHPSETQIGTPQTSAVRSRNSTGRTRPHSSFNVNGSADRRSKTASVSGWRRRGCRGSSA